MPISNLVREEILKVAVIETRTVIPCTVCEGSGAVSKEEMTDYHKRDYSTWSEECSSCGGEGLVVRLERKARVELALFPELEKRKYDVSRGELSGVLLERLNGRRPTDFCHDLREPKK